MARNRSEHGFRDDCNFGGRRTITLGLEQETFAPVSQRTSYGISQTVTRTKTLLSSSTEFKHSVCWGLFEFPAQLPRCHTRAFSLNFGVGHGLRA